MLKNILTSALISISAITAQAATITWTVHPITNNVSDVSTKGTLVDARNGSKRTHPTVNGVTFQTVDKSGNLFDTLFKNDNIGNRGAGNVVKDQNYYQFLQYGQRSGRGEPKHYATVHLTGLAIGHTYQIQIWCSDDSSTAKDTGLVLGNGTGGSPVYGEDTILLREIVEDGAGQYGIGTFVADATSQRFNVRHYKSLLKKPTAEKHLHFSNGWQLRDLGRTGATITPPKPKAQVSKPDSVKSTQSSETPKKSRGIPNYNWDNDPDGIKVFILAGQSNMVGYGKVEQGGNPDWYKGSKAPKEIKGGIGCLRYLAINDEEFPEYDYSSLLKDPGQARTSDWKSRSDVKLWWRNGGSGNLGGNIQKGDLSPLANNNQWFGPEYGFGQIIGDYYEDHDVLIIKTAWGGRSLAKDFRPPSAVAKRGGEVGEFYKAILDNTHEVLSQLGSEFPEWRGKGYQIAGIGWHQGFNDRVSNEFTPEYKDNLPDLIHDLRAAFDQEYLPFVVASTGMGNAGPVEPYPYPGYTEVEKSQLWVNGIDQPGNVLSVDTRPFWHDPGTSPSTMGHHWNHNAESYFLIGKSMADNMVMILKRLESHSY